MLDGNVLIPLVDKLMIAKGNERRDYGDYWPASSAGYCMRRVIFDRLQVPFVKEDARKQRIFESGHIFHEWMQRLTKDNELSIAQETELQDETLGVRGHIDDLLVINGDHILIDYKTQNSRAFQWQKGKPISYFHKMQVGTYIIMLRDSDIPGIKDLSVAILVKISKDDLRMSEQKLLWNEDLKEEVASYWKTLSKFWENKILPDCTCSEHEGGFLAKEAYNPYFFNNEPCSIEWASKHNKLSSWKAERIIK